MSSSADREAGALDRAEPRGQPPRERHAARPDADEADPLRATCCAPRISWAMRVSNRSIDAASSTRMRVVVPKASHSFGLAGPDSRKARRERPHASMASPMVHDFTVPVPSNVDLGRGNYLLEFEAEERRRRDASPRSSS